MTLSIATTLLCAFASETDFLLQIEAAQLPEQTVSRSLLTMGQSGHLARIPAQDGIGERIWLRANGLFEINYSARVTPQRIDAEIAALPALEPHLLPGETVQYLMDSRYCPADKFHAFALAEFGELGGGARIAAMAAWIAENFTYTLGVSDSNTTALESFVERRGVCRDYAHVLVTLARASAVPARYVSVYAPDVFPQDFHAVAEVFLGNPEGPGGAWHLVDPTGMAAASEMAKIGIGRDAADVSFLTSFGNCELLDKVITVIRQDELPREVAA